MTIQTRIFDYYDGNTCLEAFLAYDDSLVLPLPAVMISHAWAGRGDFACQKAREMAKLGYVGFALDMYGKNVFGSNPKENAKLMQPFMQNRSMLQRRILTALETARAQKEIDRNRIAAMGFCFGGLCVLDLARTSAELKGVISVHGLFNPPGNTDGNLISAKVLALHGHDDPMVPIDDVIALEKELTNAEADWQIHTYGNTMHAFTNPHANDPAMGTVYREQSAKRAWLSIQNFLHEIFV